jgi:hypothetical protein
LFFSQNECAKRILSKHPEITSFSSSATALNNYPKLGKLFLDAALHIGEQIIRQCALAHSTTMQIAASKFPGAKIRHHSLRV